MVEPGFSNLAEALIATDGSRLNPDRVRKIVEAVRTVGDAELEAIRKANKLQFLEEAITEAKTQLDAAKGIGDEQVREEFANVVIKLKEKISKLKKS